jgi:hypothetical protein
MRTRTGPDAMRDIGLTIQLIPLTAIAVLLFFASKPPGDANGVPGVTGAPNEPLWLFPFSIALGLVGLAAIVSRRAAAAAAVLALVAFAYFLQFINQKPPEILGMSFASFFAALAVVSIVGWAHPSRAAQRFAVDRT